MVRLEDGQEYDIMNSGSMKHIGGFQDNVLPMITQSTISVALVTIKIVGTIVIIFIAVLMMMKDYDEYKNIYENSRFYEDIHKVTGKLSDTGIAYLKTQAIIMMISAGIMTCGLLIIKNNYAFLIGDRKSVV